MKQTGWTAKEKRQIVEEARLTAAGWLLEQGRLTAAQYRAVTGQIPNRQRGLLP